MNSFQKSVRLGANLLRIAITNPRRLSHALGTALVASESVANPALDLLRFPGVSLDELIAAQCADVRVTLALLPGIGSSISVLEAVALILLMKQSKASHVFEFGTYKGLSITQLALNLSEDSSIYTLDLPEDDPRSAFAITSTADRKIAREKGKGSMIPPDVRERIQLLNQDSALFDPGPFEGQMDFVFVDGAHNEAYVRNDTEKAWRMVRPGGTVAWHDCRVADPEVVRYLLQSEYKPSRIEGTSLAFAIKPGSV